MKRIGWMMIAVVAIGYFFNSYTENKARREAERAENERIEQATKGAVAQMASRANAARDWEAALSKGERFRYEPILTVELEQLWLRHEPILFIGAIKDIATHNPSQYLVSVERSFLASLNYMFGTELQLSLLSDKEKIDSFLKEHPDLFADFGFKNGVAVVAHINSIRTTHVLGEDGEHVEVRIGDGELIDILYTGDVSF